MEFYTCEVGLSIQEAPAGRPILGGEAAAPPRPPSEGSIELGIKRSPKVLVSERGDDLQLLVTMTFRCCAGTSPLQGTSVIRPWYDMGTSALFFCRSKRTVSAA